MSLPPSLLTAVTNIDICVFEYRYAMMWGTDSFEDNEKDRLEYFGDKDVSPVDGQPIVYYPQ